jgi:hypothetical protein
VGVVVVPDRCGQRKDALSPAMVCPPWYSRSSWPFRVSLMDSMTCRNGLNSAERHQLHQARAHRNLKVGSNCQAPRDEGSLGGRISETYST